MNALLPNLTTESVLALLAPWRMQLEVFALVLFRVSGMLSVGPLLGRAILPWQARVGLALSLSVMLAPLAAINRQSSIDVVGLTANAVTEFALGFLLSCSALLILWAVPLAGHLMDQQHGTPADDSDAIFAGSPQTRWLTLWGATCFLLCSPINGHIQLVKILADSFQAWPVTESSALLNFDLIAGLLQHATRLSLLVLAPGLATLFLVNLALSLFGAASTPNVAVTLGSGLRPVAAMLVLGASLTGVNQFVADAVRTGMPQTLFESPSAHVEIAH